MNSTFYVIHSTSFKGGELTEQNAFTSEMDALKHYDRQRDKPAIMERHFHSKEVLSCGVPVTRKVQTLKSKNI